MYRWAVHFPEGRWLQRCSRHLAIFLVGVIFSLSLPADAYFGGRPVRDAAWQVVGAAGAYTACNVNLWTDWQAVWQSGNIHVGIDFDDANSDATTTAVNMRCETYPNDTPADDAGRDMHGLDGGVFAAGALTLTGGIVTWTNPLGAGAPNDESWTWTITNLPDNYLNCLFTCTGGDASDMIRVYFSGESP